MIKDPHLQFFFSHLALQLNYKSDQMVGIVAPTDSRFREDQRLFEDGELDQAEVAKC